MTGIIYLATNQVNGKVYVGQTYRKLSVRMDRHYSDAKRAGKRKTKDYHFYRALRKYKKSDWLWDELENFEMEEKTTLKKVLNKYEIYYIKVCESTDQDYGYNSTFGGEGVVPNEYTKHKISIALKGKSNWWKGRPKSAEQRKKMSDSKVGQLLPEVTKKKIQKSCKANAACYWQGKHRYDSTKEKLSIAKLGTKDSLETKAKKSKSATLAWARRKGT